jgi:hypothetical protein
VRRGYQFALIGLGVVVFLVVSALLARAFSIDGAEQSAITTLLQAEARGDAAGMIERIKECGRSPACRARAATDAAALREPGQVNVIKLDASAGFSLGSTLGTARVVWRIADGLPIVQCVRVRRAGNLLNGLRVELLEISRRIPSDKDCPASY